MANSSGGKGGGGLRVIGQPGGDGGKRSETPRQRLKRLGPPRVAQAVKAIRHVALLGNPQVYDVRDKDRSKIREVLLHEIEALDYALANPGKPAPDVEFDDC